MYRYLLILLRIFLVADLICPLSAYALSPEAAVREALVDLDRQNNEDQPFLRYLFEPNISPEYLVTFTPALKLHVNLISTQATLAYPRQIVPGLWRVDIRDYGWQRQTFENLANTDPYFHRNQVQDVVVEREVVEEVTVEVEQPYGFFDAHGHWYQTEIRKEKRVEKRKVLKKEKRRQRSQQLYVPQGAGQLASLALLAKSNQPIVRADWFLVQSARQLNLLNQDNTGSGYYDFLQVKNRDDFFKLIGFRADFAAATEIRAVVGDSKVTIQNRAVLRDGVANGGHWSTQEVDNQSGRGVAIQELRDGELNHVAEEHYAPLLNGLPATFLSDQNGVRQDSVPDKIAGNKSELNIGNDTRVHVNLACMQCHAGQVLQPIGDDVRATYTGRLGLLSSDKGVQLELSRQYGGSLNRFLAQDRLLYQNAFTTVTGLKPQDAATVYSQAFTKYAYGRVTLPQAALELGVSEKQLLKGLRDGAVRLGRGDFRTDPFLLDEPGATSRLNFEDAFQDTQDILYGVLNVNPSVNDGGVGGSKENGPGVGEKKR